MLRPFLTKTIYSFVFVLTLWGCAGSTGEIFPERLADDLQSALEDRYKKVNAPGISMTIAMPNGVTWVGTTGFAKVDPEEPVQANDQFRIGSITKTFNAAVILQLIEEGILSLEDQLDVWVPGFSLGPDVTIKKLLTHTSGIFNYTDDPGFLGQESTTPTGVVDFALEHEHAFEPGAGWSYSNTGFFLTGLIIEAAEGRPFHQSIRARLLDPLGLDHTYMADHESGTGHVVDGHVAKVYEKEFAPDFDMSWAWAAGGMISNGLDLCTWAQNLLRPDSEDIFILTQESREQMQQPVGLPDGSSIGYGLGLDLSSRGGRSVIGHTGSTMGFKGEVFIDVDTGACLAILTNDFLSEPRELSDIAWERLGVELNLQHN